MYYYEKYSVYVLGLSILFISAIIFGLFRKKISSLVDPIVFHFLWCSSGLALLFGYSVSKGVSIDSILFISVYVFYLLALYFFLDEKPLRTEILQRELSNVKIRLFVVSLLLNIISRYDFFLYVFNNPSIIEWFLYRFKQIEGRNVLQYIFQVGARPFFIYYSLTLFFAKPRWRLYIGLCIFINLILDVLAGGRSSVIGLLLTLGYFVYFFNPVIPFSTVRKFNWYGVALLGVALFMGALVTSFYKQDATLTDGSLAILNRLLAAGDGVEMHLANNASMYLKTGVGEYIKSVFGIFIKRVIDIQTQSVGWQLYELEHGVSVPFAVGPNYILPLQAFTLGKLFIIPYSLFMGYLVSFLRGNRLKKRLIKNPSLSFVLGLLSFEPALDMELFIFTLSGCLSVYFLVFYPINKFRIVFR